MPAKAHLNRTASGKLVGIYWKENYQQQKQLWNVVISKLF